MSRRTKIQNVGKREGRNASRFVREVGELGADACGRCEDYNDWGRPIVLTVGFIYSRPVSFRPFFLLLADFQHGEDAAHPEGCGFCFG
jgi:hypothetical protein